MNRSRIILLSALLAGLAGCAGKQKTTGPVEVAAPTGGDGKKPAEPQMTGRSLRLFEDANRAYAEQKQLKVFDWQVLERKYRVVVEADDRFAEAWYDLGVVYERLRRTEDAKSAYRTALEKKPTLRQAAENLAVIYQNENNPKDAVAIYQDILSKYPDDGAARARMAAIYREAGDFERALRLAREALMREPKNITAYKVLMRVYLERNELSMAKLVALRAVKDATDPELYYTIGLVLAKEGDEAGALLRFAEAARARDEFLAARVRIAEIAVRHRDWATAAEQYRKVLQYDPKNAAARVNLGVAYKGLGEIDKALAEYEAATKADRVPPEVFFNLGVLFQKHKDAPEKAIENYKKFVEASGERIAGNHPAYEGIRECEQYIRQMQEAKAAEEKAKREAEEQKRLEEQKKKEEADRARAEEEAKKAAEKATREKAAKDAVDSALKGDKPGAGTPEPPKSPATEPKKPAETPPPAPESKRAPATPSKAPAAASDEPVEP